MSSSKTISNGTVKSVPVAEEDNNFQADDNFVISRKQQFDKFCVIFNEKMHKLLTLLTDIIAFAFFAVFHKFYTKLSKPLFMKLIIEKSELKVTEKKHGDLMEHEKWDIVVKDDRMYAKSLAFGMCGFIEAYIERLFECKDIEYILTKIAESEAMKFFGSHPYSSALRFVNNYFDVNTIENRNSHSELIEWDLDMFRVLCAPHMLFSTANFSNTNVYREATINQMDFIATKLKLKPGMSVLDIGCGFGVIPEYLAKNYQVKVTGITISQLMVDFARKACTNLNVEIHNKDYREIEGKFDRIICIEMFEYIGERNWNIFFEKVNKLLTADGLFLLQTTTNNQSYMNIYEPVFERFLQIRRTFPHIMHLTKESNGFFVVEHYENIGYDCGLTFNTWLKNFRDNWPFLSNIHDERFYRIATAFLAYSSALFRSRKLHLTQTVFSKDGYKGGYRVNPDENYFTWKF